MKVSVSRTTAAPIYLVAENPSALDLGSRSELRSRATVVGAGLPALLQSVCARQSDA